MFTDVGFHPISGFTKILCTPIYIYIYTYIPIYLYTYIYIYIPIYIYLWFKKKKKEKQLSWKDSYAHQGILAPSATPPPPLHLNNVTVYELNDCLTIKTYENNYNLYLKCCQVLSRLFCHSSGLVVWLFPKTRRGGWIQWVHKYTMDIIVQWRHNCL